MSLSSRKVLYEKKRIITAGKERKDSYAPE
jgi:hypothetical protein